MKTIWHCLLSPRLYKIYNDGPRDALYQPHMLEKWGDRVISTANMLLKISLYSSPFICMYIYKRSFYSLEEAKALGRFFGGMGCLLAFSFLLRGIGRASNPKYVTFLKTITTHEPKLQIDNIRRYDFDFHYWPVTYSVPPIKTKSWFHNHPFKNCANPDLPSYQKHVIQVLAYLATHIFGLRLIYPGCMGLVNTLLYSTLLQGRTQLVEQFNGKRTKVETAEGNHIDTMFVDKRGDSPKGGILVICSEGNSGFYEIGIITTPIKAGYSALGWNHPGFAESTGTPFPEQEQHGIDAVMQYAINELGFEPEQIVLFGWSIGGYTAAWAANQYPVKALILDATFDDLLPLARNQMPQSWSLLVKEVVRSYVDLNIAEMVSKFDGPVKLIRRTEDEIICLRQGLLSTNRGNHLVRKLIQTRHSSSTEGNMFTPLDKFIALQDSQRAVLERTEINIDDRKSLELISKYMMDYKSTHCTPLPSSVFETAMNNLSH